MIAGTYPAGAEMCICVSLCDCLAFACRKWRIQRNLKDILCCGRDLNWEPSEYKLRPHPPSQRYPLDRMLGVESRAEPNWMRW